MLDVRVFCTNVSEYYCVASVGCCFSPRHTVWRRVLCVVFSMWYSVLVKFSFDLDTFENEKKQTF